VAKGAGARQMREWSAEIRLIALLAFGVLVFLFLGLLSPKLTQLRVVLVIVFHEVGFTDYISRLPTMLKRTKKSTTRVLPLHTAVLLPLRLQTGGSRAPAIGRAGLRNLRLCDPAPGEGE
jgi:hypothetical protein